MVVQMNSKHTDNKITVESPETDDEIEVNLGSKQKNVEVFNPEKVDQQKEIEVFNFENAAREAFDKSGRKFMSEVLPKLPKLRNGMRLLCVHEQSPLVNTGELYKARIFRPDRPLTASEIFEDGSRVRFTNLSRMVNDDFVVARFKFEVVSFKAGVADNDMLGLKSTPGVFEAEDISNLTLKPFIERKIKGKTSIYYYGINSTIDLLNVVLEITVLKKTWESEITSMKDNCAIQYGSECSMNMYCMLCLVKDDMRELTRMFESNEEKGEFGKINISQNDE